MNPNGPWCQSPVPALAPLPRKCPEPGLESLSRLVHLVRIEGRGQAALVHQFPGGGRLCVLDVELLEPLPQQVATC